MSLSMKRRTTYAMAAMSLVVAGCVSDDPDPNLASIATGEIAEIVLDEFSFEAKTIDVVAGSTVTIRLVNAGFIDHEFMIGQVVSPGGGYDDDLLSQMVIAAEGTGFTSAGFSLADAAVHDDGDAHEPDEHMDDAAVHDDGDAHEPDEHMDDAAVHDDEAAHGHQGAHVTVEPGGVVELTLLVPADAVGTWEIGCFLEGHYEAGMLGTFNVQPSAA